MKNWIKNFIEDMKYIWWEFRWDIVEINVKKSYCDDDMVGISYFVNWNNVFDLDL